MRRHLPFGLLAAVALAGYLVVQYRWFPHLSKNNDEPVYLFQSAMLRDGHLTLSAADVGVCGRTCNDRFPVAAVKCDDDLGLRFSSLRH